ncbi:helix-turn-helix domain-containing protein [Streptomyces sp. NBC_00445]|uniref:helix-turn-helix domain-containing protein n=1 Tax=Streptomyces sp. NBC_00445 TaxID=2975745 RepID=UPI002E1CA7B3
MDDRANEDVGGSGGGSVGPGVFAEMVAATPVPLWVIGADGAVAFANPAALALLGYRSAAEVIGESSHDTLHRRRPDGSDYPPHACPILDRAGSHEAGEPEWFLTRGGRALPVTWTTRALGSSGRRLLSFAEASDRLAANRRGPAEQGRAPRHAADFAGVPSRRSVREAMLRRVREEFGDPDFTVAALAREFHLSVRSLQALFAEAGISPAAEIRRVRLEFAAGLLAGGSTIRHAALASGFTDPGTFARAFRRQYGESPGNQARRAG